MFSSKVLLLLVVLELYVVSISGFLCYKEAGNLCSCRMENGSIISLDSLSGGESPVFSDVMQQKPAADGKDYRYYYDPCRSFALPEAGPACHGVSVCQKDGTSYYNLGELGHTEFGYNDTVQRLYISYRGCYEGQCRTTNVSLQCDWGGTEPVLIVYQQTPGLPFDYNMTLRTRCACPDGCRAEVHTAGMSAGGVFLVVVCVAAIFYLVVGVAFRRIVVGATGWEVLPNRRFWAELPGLVRDGVTYCITCRRADTTYDQI